MTTLSPLPRIRFFDASGDPLAGGKLYTYVAGTTTPKVTYTNFSGNTANTNPVILDAAGEADVWLSGNYKMILKNSSDVQQWERDNISGLPTDLPQWLTVTGTDNILGTPSTQITGYAAQQTFYFIAAGTNTTAVTINISGLGTKDITKDGSTALQAGDIVSGSIIQIVYDGTRFQLQNPQNVASTKGATFTGNITMSGAAINEAAEVSLASASTVNIGAAASNNILITGTTTITSLGTAVAGITRNVRFAASLTLTHNATSLILPGGKNIITAANDILSFLSLGSGNWISLKYSPQAGEILTVKQQYFTSNGTYTPSSGMLYAQVEAKGGGGGGGIANSSSFAGSGGGGEGGTAISLLTAANIGASQSVTIGSGGASGASGTSTSLGSLVSAPGGSPGGTDGAQGYAAGGAGGAGGTGSILIPGCPGGIGTQRQFVGGSGIGGMGGGKGGGVTVPTNTNLGGTAGVANSGGGGSGAFSAAGTANGGAGGSGYLIITEYCCR